MSDYSSLAGRSVAVLGAGYVGGALVRTGDPRGGAAAMVAAGAIIDREAPQ